METGNVEIEIFLLPAYHRITNPFRENQFYNKFYINNKEHLLHQSIQNFIWMCLKHVSDYF